MTKLGAGPQAPVLPAKAANHTAAGARKPVGCGSWVWDVESESSAPLFWVEKWCPPWAWQCVCAEGVRLLSPGTARKLSWPDSGLGVSDLEAGFFDTGGQMLAAVCPPRADSGLTFF